MQPIRVISLVRHEKRRAEFRRRNAHVDFSFFDAVDGHALAPEQIEACGLFAPEVRADYGPQGFGCAMSHWHLWKEAAAGTQPLTIAEDDAVFRRDFPEWSARVLASLVGDWDLVLWGWNFDSVLLAHPMGAVSPVLMFFDQGRLRDSLDEFQALQAPVQPLKLERAFGLPAYTLSPGGAAKYLRQCFPQRAGTVYIPGFNIHVRNVNVDVSTNMIYGETAAFACFPPLVASPNVRGQA